MKIASRTFPRSPGLAGTTLAHALAWEFAREGYPVLLAKQLPFVPDALPVVNFLSRVRNADHSQSGHDQSAALPGNPGAGFFWRHYEAPWLIVFDSLHWQYRDSELVRLPKRNGKGGSPGLLLVVTGPELGLSFFNSSIFKKLTDLNHAIALDEAQNLVFISIDFSFTTANRGNRGNGNVFIRTTRFIYLRVRRPSGSLFFLDSRAIRPLRIDPRMDVSEF